jgi:competence protein ComEC
MRIESPRPRRLLSAPLAPIALALSAGILIDRNLEPFSTRVWGSLALVGALAALVVWRRRALAAAVLLFAFTGLGGGWHHLRWSDLRSDDLARVVSETPQPAWLRGVLVELPEFRPGERPGDTGRTRGVLEVASQNDGRAWHQASGRVLLSIAGDRSDLAAGAPVFAAGSLAQVGGPLNPGEFDRREYLRSQGIRLQLATGDPDGVWPDPDGTPWPFAQRLGTVRAWCHERLVRGLDPAMAPLAAALLLGRREAVDADVNDAFLRTGTTHLLAFSGLQLQVLAATLLIAARVAGMNRWWAFALAGAAMVAYAALVGPMPSVVRSAAMTVAACLATMRHRYGRPANVFALAAIFTLAANPTHLFDIGCQLSFLAVAALFWGVPLAQEACVRPLDPLDALERRLAPRWKKVLRQGCTVVGDGLVLSTVVWLVTLPLVALRFHMLSPVGIILNVPLVPLSSAALMFAGLTLVLSAIWAPLGWPAAWICRWLLGATELIVRWGASWPWGHAFTPGPSVGWVWAVYAALAVVTLAWWARWRVRRWSLAALGGLLGIGLAGALRPEPGRPLEADVLAVGHGLAVVVQAEPGRAVVYDCGRMGDPHVGRRVIAPALWARGVGRLDAVVLSHADADHYNGLPDLLERFRIGRVYVPPGFGGPANPGAQRLLSEVRARGITLRTLTAGDRMSLSSGASALVRHPAADWMPDAADNDRSLVLDVSSEGRHLLLTGDLEAAGQTELVSHKPTPIDAMIAPHHGGRTANGPRLYHWAQPASVLVSQRAPAAGTRDALAPLEAGGIAVLRTWERGAIRVRWLPSRLDVSGFLDSPPPSLRVPFASVSSAWSRGAVVLLGLLVGGALCFVLAIVEWGAWALVRPGRRPPPGATEPASWEVIEATADDGTILLGAWRTAEASRGQTAVLLHGFAEEHTALISRAEALHRGGWSVALPDVRGRGRSGGEWTSFGGREAGDLRRWIDVLSQRVGPEMHLAAWGRSMGAAIVLRAAAEDSRIAAVVLEAPYPDLRVTVAAWLGRLRIPAAFAGGILRRAGQLAGVPLADPRPIDLAPRVTVPVMILQGSDDPIVPSEAVQRLARAFPNPPRTVEIAGAGHADIFDIGGPVLIAQVAQFLDQASIPTESPRSTAAASAASPPDRPHPGRTTG